jgi:uncharacterized lipoprotein YddW (UPF0748 family)
LPHRSTPVTTARGEQPVSDPTVCGPAVGSDRPAARQWLVLAALALLMGGTLGIPEAWAQSRAEWRGFWVDTFNTRISTPEDTAAVVERAQQARVNVLFVQVRRRGDAWYLDSREPLPETVAIATGFDPLRDLVARAHDAGLQVHAFVVVGAVWNLTTLPSSPTHVFNQHGFTPAGPHAGRANWLTRTLVADGGAISFGGFRFGSDFWLDFGHPEAAAYTVDVLRHLVSHYEVDGLHLDRICYPEFAEGGLDVSTGANVGYNDVSLERFRRRYGLAAAAMPSPSDAAWSDWRREQVTALVRRLYLEIAAINSRVVLSAAVIAFGDAPGSDGAWPATEAYWRVFQDWRAWTEEGIVDLVVPMVYRTEHTSAGAETFSRWVAWTHGHHYERHAAIGLGAYLNSIEGTLRQVRRALEPAQGAPGGAVLFSFGAHNAPVSVNPLAGSHDTPYRSFEDVASSLTTGRTTSGQSVDVPNQAPVFRDVVPVPEMPWKTRADRGHVKGLVTSATGAIDGAASALESEDGLVRVTAGRSDGNGFFGRVGMAPGSYRVVVTPLGEGSFRSACTVTVSAGSVASIELRIDSSPAIATCPTGSPARATRRP